jgi:hypothetical protein
MLLQPKNWAVFQHYKDRCPPWIKLHRDLLNDRAFMRLPIASKAIAPMLWLLASESKDGVFDGSLDELVFRLHISEKEYKDGLKPLIDNNFFTIVTGVLAECKQVAIPETETEGETETKKRQKEQRGSRLANNWVLPNDWEYWANKERPDLNAAQVADQFKDFWCSKAGKDAVKLDWLATWRNWVRNQKIAKPNFADIVRLTVAPSNEPDPALEKIKADEKRASPMPDHIRQAMNALRKKA